MHLFRFLALAALLLAWPLPGVGRRAAFAAGAAPVQLEAGGAPVGPANPLKVDNSGQTQPVGGTVTSNQGGAPWTVNPGTAANWGVGAAGAAAPGNAQYTGAVSGGNLTGLIQADTSVAIAISTATTTQLVALAAGKKIYVTALDVIAGGTGNITFEYGTGTSCGTGTTALTGAYTLTAQAGVSQGGGLGPILVVPAGNALCALTSAAVAMSGSLAFTQF